jgi:HEAT repeat protein
MQLFINELDTSFSSIKEYVKTQLITLAPQKLISLLIQSLKNEFLSDEHKIEILKLIGYEIATINASFEDLSYIKTKYPEVIEDLLKNKKVLLDEITLVLKQEDSELMGAVISILKILGNQINREIINLLLGDDFIVKKNAITLAGKLKLTEAVDVLTLNLDNIYNEVSIASIIALGEIGDTSAVADLLSILNIEDISYEYTDLDMKFYILDAVKKIYLSNINASYDYLYSHLTSQNDTIKESIAFLFGEIGKSEFVEPLINLLKTRNLDVKKNAVIALGKIGKVESLEDLVKIVKDPNVYWLIKKVATDAIYNIYHKNWYKQRDKEGELKRTLIKDMAQLIEHLKNEEEENYKVKLSIIKLLEVFGEELALNALLKRVNDFHRIVRIHASNAIKRIEERLEAEN